MGFVDSTDTSAGRSGQGALEAGREERGALADGRRRVRLEAGAGQRGEDVFGGSSIRAGRAKAADSYQGRVD